jgi:integrase
MPNADTSTHKKPAPLTPLAIRAIKAPAEGRLDIADGATPGLCLRVSAADAWMWTLRMRAPTGLRRFNLGVFTSAQGLAWARKEAERLRQQVRHDGQDPHRERQEQVAASKAKAERDRLTLGVLVEDWKRLHLAGRSDRYTAEAVRALRTAFKDQWKGPAEALDRVAVKRALNGLGPQDKNAKPRRGIAGDGSAIKTRTVAYGRACFGWAMKEERIAANPFLAVQISKSPKGDGSRERVLTDDELTAIWRATEATPSVFGRLVRMLILTGQRREEVASMAWAEISADQATWTIPGARTKNGKAHRVPLSDDARALLPAPPAASDQDHALVFPGQRGTAFAGWSKAKAELDLASGVSDWRIHDLRRTLATGLQRLGVRLEVTEALLNHVSGKHAGIVGVYQRYDWAAEKIAALDAWTAYVAGLVKGQEAGSNVVPMRAATAA